MTEEVRTTRVDLSYSVSGDTQADAAMSRVSAKVAQAALDMNKLMAASLNMGGALDALVKDNAKLGVSVDAIGHSLDKTFGQGKLAGYADQLQKVTLAFLSGKNDVAGFVGGLDLLEKNLQGTSAMYKVNSQDIGRFVQMMLQARTTAQEEAKALGLVGDKLEAEVQARTNLAIVRDRETAAVKRQEAALSALNAETNGQAAAARAAAEAAAAQERQLVQLRKELGDTAGASAVLEARTKAVTAQFAAGKIEAAEYFAMLQRARQIAAGPSPVARANAGLSDGSFGLGLSNTLDKEEALRTAQAQRESVAQLEALRREYGNTSTAADKLGVDMQNLTRQFIAGNVRAAEYVAMLQRAKQMAAETSQFAQANAGFNSGVFSLNLSNALDREAASRLAQLRQEYGEAGTAADKLKVDLQELARQFAAGNTSISEYIALVQRARAAAAGPSQFVSPNTGLQNGNFARLLGNSLDKADADEGRRLALSYNMAGEAAKKLAADQDLLNRRLAEGKLTIQEHATYSQNLAAQQAQLVQTGAGLSNAFQRQQILQAGLVNTFQSLAAGQGVFSTLFIQSTQLIGAFGDINLKLLAVGIGVAVAAAAFIGLGTSIAKVGDAAVLAEARIEALTGSAAQARAAYDALRLIGQNTGISANAAAGDFSRLLIGADQLKATQAEVLQLTQTFQQLGIIGGGSTQQISAGMQQFVQAMSKGKLDGDELRSIMENLPLVTRLLSQELGVSVGQLRDMGAAGELTSRRVFDALLARAQETNALFNAMPMTMERGWNQFKVSIEAALVDLNRFLGLAQGIGAAFAAGARGVNAVRIALGMGSDQERSQAQEAELAELLRRRTAMTMSQPSMFSPGMSEEVAGLGYNRANPNNMGRRGAAGGFYADPVATPEAGVRGLEDIDRQIADLRERLGISRRRLEVGGVNTQIGEALADRERADAAALQRERDRTAYLNDNRGTLDPRDTLRREYQERTNRLTGFQREVQAELDSSTTSLERRNELMLQSEDITRQLAGATKLYEDGLKSLDRAGAAAARTENERVERLRNALDRSTQTLDQTGVTRAVRAYGNLAEAIRDVSRDSNEAARAGTLVADANRVQERVLAQLSQGYAETNRQIALGTQQITDKTRISELEVLGTRDAIQEIDRITRARELERVALEETARLRQIDIDLMSEQTRASPELLATITREREEIVALYEQRRAAINDPANSRMGQELAREQTRAIDFATKTSADFFYDVFTGKAQSIGKKLKEVLLRAVADGLAQQVFRPIIAPIIAQGVSMFSGFMGGATNNAGGLTSAGLAQGVLGGAGGVSQAGSLAAGMQQGQQSLGLFTAGRYGNLGNAFTNSGGANTGFGLVDSALNYQLIAPSLTANTSATTSALGAMGSGVYGPATPSSVLAAGGSNGLTVAGGLGAGASILGGGYSIYNGIQRGGPGGAVGVVGGVAGVAGGAASLAGAALAGGTSALAAYAPMLATLGPYGMIAAAVLAVVAAMLPGEKASGKGQLARTNLDTEMQSFEGLGGKRFSQGNKDMAAQTVDRIVDLTKQIGDQLGGSRIGGNVAVGVTSSRGDGPGDLYLEIGGQKAQFKNDEEGSKQLGETAAKMILNEFRGQSRVQGDYRGILNASGDSVERLGENLKWYEEVYKTFQDTATAADKMATATKAVENKFNPLIDKAHELGLSSDRIVEARQREMEATIKAVNQAEANRVAELASIKANLTARLYANDQAATYDARLQAGNIARSQAWQNELTQLEARLTELGASTEEITGQIAELTSAQSAEYWANFGATLDALDRSNTGRILRAVGRTGEADRSDFEQDAKDQIKELSATLANLGVSAELAARKIAETEQAIQYERIAAAEANLREINKLSQNYGGRYMRAIGLAADADLADFEYNASEELRQLGLTLQNLGATAGDTAATMLAAELTLGAERIALQKRIADEAAAAQEQAAAEAKAALEQMLSAGKSIRAYVDAQRSTVAAGVSPEEALTAAQAQFGTDLTLARGGNSDALARITGTADRLLGAAQTQYASGVDYQAIRTFILSSLESLPATKGYDAQMLQALSKIDASILAQSAMADAAAKAAFTQELQQATLLTTQNGLLTGQSSLLNATLVIGRETTSILGTIATDMNHLWRRSTGEGDGLTVQARAWAHANADLGSIVKFEKGGIFNSPTKFQMGMMGEAGPEAIMPLETMADGSYGVRAVQTGNEGLVAAVEALQMQVAELTKELVAVTEKQTRVIAAVGEQTVETGHATVVLLKGQSDSQRLAGAA